ncbi:MAG: ThiF family adenylyltransferase [Lachnospiraceae bacterium]|nr:ThiF family adenylyltransferase [Lachnospiraceae bacterium]
MKYRIVIIGCGGTGGNFMKELGRFLYNNGVKGDCSIVLADGDIVEKSNITRQPFLPEDVGRKKVEVMSEILQEAFEVSCEFYPEYINHVSDLEKLERDEDLTILVGCVDNHACRKVMHEYYQKKTTCCYIDSANEYSCGEVVVAMKMSGMELSPDRAHYFPEILTDTSLPRSEESCIVLNESSPQHLVTNLFASYLLLKCIVEIITDEDWEGGIYYFDAFKGFSQHRERTDL